MLNHLVAWPSSPETEALVPETTATDGTDWLPGVRYCQKSQDWVKHWEETPPHPAVPPAWG